MRSTHCRVQIFSRTTAWIEESAFTQPLPRGQIYLAPFALRIRPERPAQIRPFVPIQPQPLQILKRRLCILGSAAFPIQIFHAHH